MKKRILTLVTAVVLLCTLALVSSASQIKNVIFMIPDGAGMNTFDFANDVKVAGGFDDTKYPNRTQVDNSPLYLKDYMAGLAATNTYAGTLTDSAAAGTALATGHKTLSGQLGVDFRGRPKANMLEAAQTVGKATGIVSTYEWPHATPASFGAHVMSRQDYENIYQQMENQKIDVVLGSGYGAVSSYATIQNAVDRGYTIITNRSDLENVQPGDRLWGNATNNSSPYDINLSATQPTLEQMTVAAITALSSDEDGFFLMVEGSKVDTGAHANDAVVSSSEYIAFDAAFKAAVEFAKGRTDTIVIATPDHDTGGMLYHDLIASDPDAAANAIAEAQAGTNPSALGWTTGSHTTQLVGVWVYLPEGVDMIEGLNSEVGDNDTNRSDYVIENNEFAPYVASLIGVDMAEVTNELFVDVTDIGVYSEGTGKFTFNNGGKYIYKNQSWYFTKDGEKIDLDGQVSVYANTRMYVPSAMVEEEDWNYVSDGSEGIQGSGSLSDPYIISDEADFLEFTSSVIAGSTYTGMYFVQSADIDMTSVSEYVGMTSSNTFSGIYNGNGYKINVNIANEGEAAVFGSLGSGGIVMNVGITGSVSSSTSYAAGIVRKVVSGAKLVNSFCLADVSSSSNGTGLVVSVYGIIENCYFGGTATTSPVGGVSSAVSVKNCYYVDTCGVSQTADGITSVTEEVAKSTLASTLESGKTDAAATAGFEEDDMCYWRQSSENSLPELYIPVPVVTDVTVTPSSATVNKGEGIQLTATVTGEYNPSTEVSWSIESTETISDGTHIDDNGYLYIDNFETASGFKVMAKSKANGAVAGTAQITVNSVYDITEDKTISSGDKLASLENLKIAEGVTLTLGRGTYIIGTITGSGEISASRNANVIVVGETKPIGYVEINIGEKADEANIRYAEVDGKQYEICEYNNLYGVIADEDMLVEITEKTSDEAVVATKTDYYFVDATKGEYTLLDMSGFMLNENDLSVRAKDKQGIRFKAALDGYAKAEKTEYELKEYGFIIAVESTLLNNGEQLNFDASTYVSGAGYVADENTDIVYDASNDEKPLYTGVLYNIPEYAYGKSIVSKTYAKITVSGNEFVVYGEPVVTSLYEIALISKGLDLSDEQKAFVDGVVEATVSFDNDLGFDAGALYE